MLKIIPFKKVCLKSYTTFAYLVFQLITLSLDNSIMSTKNFNSFFIKFNLFYSFENYYFKKIFPRICVQLYFIFYSLSYREIFFSLFFEGLLSL